jgi:pimeloyl-ACP methyl ester carboxylesterase
LDALLEHAARRHRIDPDRVYVTGLSMGGYGTWALAIAFPTRFAAIVPVCGGGEPERAYRIAHLPAWVFHGALDEIVPLSESEAMVAALCRALAAVAVVFALAGLYRETAHPESGACIVAAIDRSASVQSAAVDTARAFFARLLPALDASDLVGSLEFGADTRVLARPSPAPPLSALVPAADVPAPEPADTDLAAALARAAPLCPSGGSAPTSPSRGHTDSTRSRGIRSVRLMNGSTTSTSVGCQPSHSTTSPAVSAISRPGSRTSSTPRRTNWKPNTASGRSPITDGLR